MFTTAATPFRDGTHLVDLAVSRDLTVCGAAVTCMSVRRTYQPHVAWLACPRCKRVGDPAYEDEPTMPSAPVLASCPECGAELRPERPSFTCGACGANLAQAAREWPAGVLSEVSREAYNAVRRARSYTFMTPAERLAAARAYDRLKGS